MTEVLQTVATGLTLGAMYAMVAVAFILVYNVTGIINFATGEFLMIGALVAVTLAAADMPLPVVFVGAALAAAVVGGLVERLTLRPARDASLITLILITIGVSIALQGIALLIWGVNPRRYGPFTAGPPLELAGLTLPRQSVWIFLFAAAVATALWWFFAHGIVGKAMRACEMDPEAARLQGISTSRMSLYAFGVATGIAGAAGMVLVPVTSASYNMGLPLALKGFIAAVIGGLVSAPGGIMGGLLLGIAESFAARYISSGLKDAIAFGLLFVVLVIRPQGLLAMREGRRV